MPNWCTAQIKVKGKNAKDVEAFCKHFVFDEDVDKETKQGYFARSFANVPWKYFKKETGLGKHTEVEFGIDFAWSAYSCLIKGYPDGTECITLMEACKTHKVYVTIDTEEEGMGFEEHIECNEKGKLVKEDCVDMPEYECQHCKETQMMPTHYDTADESCYSCETVGKWKQVKRTK